MKEKILQKRNVCDLQTVLSTVEGRSVLYRVLQSAQIGQHGFVPGDAFSTAFHCGQKSIGLFLLTALEEASPGVYARMRAEYLAEVKTAQAEIDRQDEPLMEENL